MSEIPERAAEPQSPAQLPQRQCWQRWLPLVAPLPVLVAPLLFDPSRLFAHGAVGRVLLLPFLFVWYSSRSIERRSTVIPALACGLFWYLLLATLLAGLIGTRSRWTWVAFWLLCVFTISMTTWTLTVGDPAD